MKSKIITLKLRKSSTNLDSIMKERNKI